MMPNTSDTTRHSVSRKSQKPGSPSGSRPGGSVMPCQPTAAPAPAPALAPAPAPDTCASPWTASAPPLSFAEPRPTGPGSGAGSTGPKNVVVRGMWANKTGHQWWQRWHNGRWSGGSHAPGVSENSRSTKRRRRALPLQYDARWCTDVNR